tara:strand:+ start:301 stop:483 length:183 start_codon:yes stop_codon:yes gene_type:complete
VATNIFNDVAIENFLKSPFDCIIVKKIEFKKLVDNIKERTNAVNIKIKKYLFITKKIIRS